MTMKTLFSFSLALLAFFRGQSFAADAPLMFNDPKPQRYELTARASQIDPRTTASGD